VEKNSSFLVGEKSVLSVSFVEKIVPSLSEEKIRVIRVIRGKKIVHSLGGKSVLSVEKKEFIRG
jgi:hypothetical protein